MQVKNLPATALDTLFSEATSRILKLSAVFLLGSVILYSVGFTQVPLAHNVAHDVRHAQGFPCH